MREILHTITCAARVEKLGEIAEFIEKCAERFGLDVKRAFGLQVAVEEAFVNICSYAYPEGGGDATMTAKAEEDCLVLEISDKGFPFNVLLLQDPDTSKDITEREIGGLGGYFIRRLTDNVSYRRENGENILKMVLHRTGTS
ncbi:MAG: ATP-binding protein [Chlorobium sp.]